MSIYRNIEGVDNATLLEIIQAQTAIARLDLDLGRVMHVAADRVRDLTGADNANVGLVDGGSIVYRAAVGTPLTPLGLRLSREASLTGLCLSSSRSLVCQDSETDPRVDREACRANGMKSMAVAPLVNAGEAIGVIMVGSTRPNAFCERDLRILDLMSEMVATAMHRASALGADALYHRATHDPLTDVANRALFYDRLRQALAQADRNGSGVAVLIIDLDDFKTINDSFGHRAGDAALVEAARRLMRASRRSDTVARLGGDEFGVVLTSVGDREVAVSQAARVEEGLNAPFEFGGGKIPLGASVGLASFPDDGELPEALIELADRSMYLAKSLRRRVVAPA
jgi:diguanylate cyclase (GGDEF)-like protein